MVLGPVRNLVYGLYQQELARQVRGRPLPRHVGIILDGNRRFARSLGLPDVAQGHKRGADKVDELLAWAEELAIPTITVWILSIDNLRRPEPELGPLLEIIEEKIAQLAARQRGVAHPRRIRGVGRLDLLPPSTREAVALAEEVTESCGPWVLNLAVGYGGREEITDAVQRLLRDRAGSGTSLEEAAQDLCPEEISRYLYTSEQPDPDLIIRTSGETRLSGFLLWQSVYSEFYFCDAFWPAFRKIDFLRAIRSYQDRQRRFGR